MFNPNGLPDLTGVTDDDRAHQGRVALVLLHLLALDLSTCSWHVDSVDGGSLEGQLPVNDRAGLQAWADAFGVGVDWQRHGGRHPQAQFTMNGVTVRVWCEVAR